MKLPHTSFVKPLDKNYVVWYKYSAHSYRIPDSQTIVKGDNMDIMHALLQGFEHAAVAAILTAVAIGIAAMLATTSHS